MLNLWKLFKIVRVFFLVQRINETEQAVLGIVIFAFFFFFVNQVAFSTTSVVNGTIQERLDFKLFMRSKPSNVI